MEKTLRYRTATTRKDRKGKKTKHKNKQKRKKKNKKTPKQKAKVPSNTTKSKRCRGKITKLKFTLYHTV